MQEQVQVPNQADLIDLTEVARKLWTHRRIIGGCVIGGLLLGILTLHSVVYTYTATVRVIPTQSSPVNVSPGALGGLASLAGLAGISLPSTQGTTPFFLYKESATSRNVADALVARPYLAERVFKGEWDATSKKFVHHAGWFEILVDAVAQLIGIPSYPWVPPNGARMQSYLKDNVDVEEDERKPIVTFSYDNEDPKFAVQFLAALNETIDNQIRHQTLVRVNENIAYLSQQLATVTLAEHRQAIIQALSDQVKTRMMASSNASFAADLLDRPNASLRPTKPNPVLILIGSLLVGLIAGIISALVWDRFGWTIEGHLHRWLPGSVRQRTPSVVE